LIRVFFLVCLGKTRIEGVERIAGESLGSLSFLSHQSFIFGLFFISLRPFFPWAPNSLVRDTLDEIGDEEIPGFIQENAYYILA
jgi:hypothetical protein